MITDVTQRGWWLDQQPVFRVRAETHHQPGRMLEFRIAEYPCWAPAPGHVIDVWTRVPLTAGEGEPERTVVQRRIVGQQFEPPREQLRRPASGGDGPGIGPAAPDWADTFTAGRNKNGAWAVGALAGIIAVAAAVLAAVVWLRGWPDGPAWWLPWSLGAAVLVTAWQSSKWLGLRYAPRRAVHRGMTMTLMPGILAFLLMFVNTFSAAFTWGDSDYFFGGREDVVALTCLGSVVAGVIPFIITVAGHSVIVPTVTSALLATAARHARNADTAPLRAEQIHEAMLSADPDQIPRLERDHGVTAELLLRS